MARSKAERGSIESLVASAIKNTEYHANRQKKQKEALEGINPAIAKAAIRWNMSKLDVSKYVSAELTAGKKIASVMKYLAEGNKPA